MAHAWRVVREAHHAGPVASEVLQSLVGAYCGSDLIDHAESLLGMYGEFGCKVNAAAYEVVLDALRGRPGQFRNLWEAMLGQTDIKPCDLKNSKCIAIQAIISRLRNFNCI